jgi:hypothetical protein
MPNSGEGIGRGLGKQILPNLQRIARVDAPMRPFVSRHLSKHSSDFIHIRLQLDEDLVGLALVRRES